MKYLAFLALIILLSGCTQENYYSNNSQDLAVNDYDSINEGHEELDYDYGDYETPDYGKSKEEINCWFNAGIVNIPCPDDWEKLSDNKWKLGNLYFEIILGTDEPSIVSSGETLVMNKPELYSGFSGYSSEGVDREAIPFSKVDSYNHLFRYNSGEYTATEIIFVYYRNYYDTEWAIVRNYGPHDELSDNWMEFNYVSQFSEELI